MPDHEYIPFSLPTISEDEIQEVADTLRSGWLSTGPKTEQFEKEFASYVGASYAVGVMSCTAAIHLALLAHKIGPGDEVIVPSFTFAACPNMVVNVGASPVFADITESTYTIDPKDIEKKITAKTKAIIVVHYAGHPADLGAINAIAKTHKLVVIEDAAHSVGTEYHGNKIGASGNSTCFSFYPTKNLTTGEGGMLTTNDESIADFARKNRVHGISKDGWKRYAKGGSWRYDIDSPGWKYNMGDIQAAMGIHQLKKLPEFIRLREEQARFYHGTLSTIPGLILPTTEANVRHTYHLYPVRVQRFSRDALIERLAEKNIGTSVHFIPNHLQSFYRGRGFKEGDLPVTEKVFSEILSLPLYPKMTEESLQYVASTMKEVLS